VPGAPPVRNGTGLVVKARTSRHPHLDDDRIVTRFPRNIVSLVAAAAPRPGDGISRGSCCSSRRTATPITCPTIALAGDRALDDVAEEPAHPIGVGEAIAREEAVELEANLVG
jgi:hypothetical protein